jgi:hypothetical protein
VLGAPKAHSPWTKKKKVRIMPREDVQACIDACCVARRNAIAVRSSAWGACLNAPSCVLIVRRSVVLRGSTLPRNRAVWATCAKPAPIFAKRARRNATNLMPSTANAAPRRAAAVRRNASNSRVPSPLKRIRDRTSGHAQEKIVRVHFIP